MSQLSGNLIATLVLGAIALLFIVLALVDRARNGRFGPGSRTRLRVALIFLAVAAWLTWLRTQG
jgi:hypothetical protein